MRDITNESEVSGGVTLKIDDNKFKEGDFVHLKGDVYNIRMLVLGNAVDARTNDKRVVVAWTRPDHAVHEAAFSESLLAKYANKLNDYAEFGNCYIPVAE